MSGDSVTEHVLDVQRLNTVFQDALDVFRTGFADNPFNSECGREASFIAWLAIFAPEALSDASKTLLRETFDVAEKIDDKGHHEVRRLDLRIALYGCTEDAGWLQLHLNNLGHGTSGVRYIVMESLAIVADDLIFFWSSLQRSIEYNLQVVHGGCEDAVALAVVGRGDRQSKILKLKEWLDRYKLNKSERDYIQALCEGESVRNHFLESLFRQQSYVFHRLASEPQHIVPLPKNETLFDMRPLVKILERLQKHPLMRSHICIVDSPIP